MSVQHQGVAEIDENRVVGEIQRRVRVAIPLHQVDVRIVQRDQIAAEVILHRHQRQVHAARALRDHRAGNAA
jgi:hypothetical protein